MKVWSTIRVRLCFLREFHQIENLLGVGCQRFFHQHVLPFAEGLVGERVVRRRWRGNHNRVNMRVGENLLVVLLQFNIWVSALRAREGIQVEIADSSYFHVWGLRRSCGSDSDPSNRNRQLQF